MPHIYNVFRKFRPSSPEYLTAVVEAKNAQAAVEKVFAERHESLQLCWWERHGTKSVLIASAYRASGERYMVSRGNDINLAPNDPIYPRSK